MVDKDVSCSNGLLQNSATRPCQLIPGLLTWTRVVTRSQASARTSVLCLAMLANKARETALKIQKSVLWAKRKMSLYPMALCVRTTVGRGIWGEEMDQTMQGFRAAWLLALLFCGQLCPSRALGSKTFLGLRRERRSYESLHKHPPRSHASVVYLIWLG